MYHYYATCYVYIELLFFLSLFFIGAYNVYVQDFMVRDVRHIWNGITFRHLKKILKENPKIRAFPIVDTPGNIWYLNCIYCFQTRIPQKDLDSL